SGLSVTPAAVLEANLASAQFGMSVASAGDVNGDGYADIIIGAPEATHGQGAEGQAYLYYGSAGGIQTTPAWVTQPDQGAAQYGYSVASAGDVNGDGYSDVVVGAPGEGTGGKAFVYCGSATGLATTPSWTGDPSQAGAGYGTSVSTAGDVNGDGFSDV